MGGSSTCSPALPMETFPRLLMFPSNFFCLLRMFRGAGCFFCYMFYLWYFDVVGFDLERKRDRASSRGENNAYIHTHCSDMQKSRHKGS